MQVRLTDAAESYITEHGFDPMYGARPLKRYVQKTVETLAAKLILKGDINTGDDIVIDVVNGELTARAEAEKPSKKNKTAVKSIKIIKSKEKGGWYCYISVPPLLRAPNIR